MLGVLLLALPILALPLVAADLRIDHVSVAGRNLKALRDALSSVGIASEYGGAHANHATEMALTSFADGSYLELIAIQPDADPMAVARHDWSLEIRHDAGPTAWAAQIADLERERSRLLAAHVRVTEPVKSGRLRPDGVELRWETAMVATTDSSSKSEARGTFFPFLIRDLTPRDQRVFTTGKPTAPAFHGLSRVVIAVKDLRAAVKLFENAYGWPAPVLQDDALFGAHLAIFQGTPVVLAAAIDKDSWIDDRVQMFGAGPCAYVLRTDGTSTLPTVSHTQWAGAQISWADTKLLGWHLGIER